MLAHANSSPNAKARDKAAERVGLGTCDVAGSVADCWLLAPEIFMAAKSEPKLPRAHVRLTQDRAALRRTRLVALLEMNLNKWLH